MKEIGPYLDDNDMNNLNYNFGLVTNAEKKLNDFLNGSGVVTRDMIADYSINSWKVIDKSLYGNKIADNTLGREHIKDGTINNNKIADKSIYGNKIADNTIAREHIEDDAINARKLNYSSIYGAHLTPLIVNEEHLIDAAVTRTKIKDGEVTRSKLADGLVNAHKIADKSIYRTKVADNTLNEDNMDINGKVLSARKEVVVIKTSDNMKILVPGRGNAFICHEMQYWDRPLSPGVRNTNVKVWAIAEIGRYYQDTARNYVKDEGNIFLHASGTPSSIETIWKLEGEVDYSGAFHHGDEISDFCKIFIGNEDITDKTGTFTGESLDMIQHSQLYEDTFTTETMTEPYLQVKKHHRFDWQDVYTLTHEVEFLKTVTPNFSCLSALTLRRTTKDGKPNNFTDCLDLTHMRYVDIRVEEDPDSGIRNHFLGENDRVRKLKVSGLNKDVTITYASPDPHFRAYLSNHNPNMAKIYTETVPPGVEVQAGEKFSATANYKWVTY